MGFDDCRHRLLGDSFSIYSFVVLAASCCHQFVPSIAYQHLAKRMGLAPGFRNILRRQVPLAKMLQYGSLHKDPKAFSNGVHLLNRFLFRKQITLVQTSGLLLGMLWLVAVFRDNQLHLYGGNGSIVLKLFGNNIHTSCFGVGVYPIGFEVPNLKARSC